MAIPKKVEQRIQQAFTKLRPIIQEAKNRDVNEADTVTLVKAILSDAFGWDPFFEVTSEFAVPQHLGGPCRKDGQPRRIFDRGEHYCPVDAECFSHICRNDKWLDGV